MATTPRCRGGHYSFPWIASLTYDFYFIKLLSKEASSTIFLAFGMIWAGIQPQFPGPLANTLTIIPMGWL